MNNSKLRKTVYSALFLAVGLILPFLTGQIKEIGDSLLPMHLPVMLCGLICGWQWGLAVGFIMPFLRSFLFGMPPMYPAAVWMSFELAAYGFTLGILYGRVKRKNLVSLYASLILSMLAGRLVWGCAKTVLLGMAGNSFTFGMFIAGGFTDALPGIVLQLLLVPVVMRIYERKKGITP